MIENAVEVIEGYLRLVRKHLPNTIAEEVISELRTYVMEAAEEEGGGLLTVEAAKRTVARFGAPSEVAKEYIDSMIIEDDGELEEDATCDAPNVHLKVSDPRITETEAPPAIESGVTRKAVKKPSSTASGFEVYLQFFIIGALWTLPLSLFGLFMAPIIVIIQLPLLAGWGFLILFWNAMTGKSRFKKEHNDDWPWLQKLAALPEGFLPVMTREGLYAEIIFTALAALSFIPAVPYWLVLPAILLRFSVFPKRMKDLDQASYAKYVALSEVITIAAINVSALLSTFPIYAGFFLLYWVPAMQFAMLLELLCIIRLVSVTPHLFVDKHIDSELKDDTTVGVYAYYQAKAIALGMLYASIVPLLSVPLLISYHIGFTGLGIYYLLIVLAINVPGLVGAHWGNIARAKKKGITLWEEDDSSWSWLRRILSFPQGQFLEQSTRMLRFDLFVTFTLSTLTFLMFLSNSIGGLPAYVFFLLSFTLVIRMVLLDERWRNQLARKYETAEFASNLVVIVVGALAISAVYPNHYIDFPQVLHPLLSVFPFIWGIYSTYVIYSLVARGTRLWESPMNEEYDKATISREESYEVTDEPITHKPKRVFLNVSIDILGWSFVASTVILLLYLISRSTLPPDINSYLFHSAYSATLLFAIPAWILATIYFRIKRRRASITDSPIIGKRRRSEAVIDLVFTSIIGSAILARFDEYIWFSIEFAQRIQNQFPSFPDHVFSLLFWIIFVNAFITRVFANIIQIAGGDRSIAMKVLEASCILGILTISMLTGMLSYLTGPRIFGVPINYLMPQLLMLLVLLIFQGVLTKYSQTHHSMKGHERPPRRKKTVIDPELGEVEIPVNY